MAKRTEVFLIRFATLYCKVTATSGMRAIIAKYISGTYVSISDHSMAFPAATATLVIHQKDSGSGITSMVIKRNQLAYVMHMNGSPHFYYPLVVNLIQRIFMALFYRNGGLVFHASAVASRGKAYVFVGDSGKGKTTIARLSHDLYNLHVLSDNQVFIRKYRGKYFVCPFPFSQFHKIGAKTCLPIAAVYILHHSLSFSTQSVPLTARLHMFNSEIQILSVDEAPADKVNQVRLRGEVFDFVTSVKMEHLYFRPEKGIWEAIHHA